MLAGALVGLWWAIASHHGSPLKCTQGGGHCISDAIGATVIPILLKTAAGVALGLALGALLEMSTLDVLLFKPAGEHVLADAGVIAWRRER